MDNHLETHNVSQRSFDHRELSKNAQLLIKEGELDEAIILLNRLLVQEPQNQWVLEKLGKCSLAVKDFSLAVDCYQRLIMACGGRKYNLNLAHALYGAKQNDLALELYLSIKNQLHGKDLYLAFMNLGNIFFQKKEFSEARKYYKEAIDFCPASDKARVNCGLLEVQAKNFNKALEYFRKAIELNSESDAAWVGLAIVHDEYGDLEIAWANLERALDIHPFNEIALHLYFEWGIRDDKVSAVINKYQSILDQPFTSDVLLSHLAKIHFCLRGSSG